MTWVIGANTPFGYGFVVSDVRITFPDGTTLDCLQKAYHVGDFIVAGFAGSVRIGFEMIRDLQEFLNPPDKPADGCWIPDWVARELAPRARDLFARAPPTSQRARCEILLMGAHPTEDGLNGARPYTSILRSPEFEPTIWNNFDSVQSIGSGAHVEEYKRLLGSSFDEQTNLTGEVMAPGGMAQVMVGGFMRRVFREPSPGVSHHLQLFTVRRGTVEGLNYEPSMIQGGIETHFRMPNLARGWNELQRLLKLREGLGVIDEATA